MGDALAAQFASRQPIARSFADDPRWLASVSDALNPGERTLFHWSGLAGSAVVPLVPMPLRRGLTWTRLESGTDPLVAMADVWVSDRANASEIIGGLFKALANELRWDAIYFRRVATDTNLHAALEGLAFSHIVADDGRVAYWRVREADSMERLPKEHLRNISRLTRRAEKQYGPMAVETMHGAAAASLGLERFLRIESLGWKGESGSGTALALDVRGAALYRSALERLGSADAARVDVLSLGGTEAAAQMSLRSGTTWYIQKIGYDPQFRDVSPGAILLKGFLEECTANPAVDTVNLTTNPEWARRWHFDTAPLYEVQIFNRTLRGHALKRLLEFKRRAQSNATIPVTPSADIVP